MASGAGWRWDLVTASGKRWVGHTRQSMLFWGLAGSLPRGRAVSFKRLSSSLSPRPATARVCTNRVSGPAFQPLALQVHWCLHLVFLRLWLPRGVRCPQTRQPMKHPLFWFWFSPSSAKDPLSDRGQVMSLLCFSSYLSISTHITELWAGVGGGWALMCRWAENLLPECKALFDHERTWPGVKAWT